MAVTRIKNNQITDSTVNAAAKLVDYSVSAAKLANNLVYSSDLTVTGNLTVQGNTTTIDTTYTVIEDPVILLASNQVGSPSVDIGFIGQRGTSQNVAFVWDESAGQFVTVYTTTGETNTTLSIASYADLHVGNANIGGNIVHNGTTSFVGNVIGAANFTANITGGNILTPGLISATSNVTGGNVLTAGIISATGNVSGGNLTTAGQLSATANITGGNVTTAGQVVATGNVAGGNVTTAGQVSATGNITSAANISGGNISTSGTFSAASLSASGNITGGNLVSNGVVTSTGNIVTTANVNGGNINSTAAVTAASVAASQTISATGNVTGGNIITSGVVTATGNISGGNVNAATGIRAVTGFFTGNVDVLGNLNATIGIVYANSGIFYGNAVTGNGAAYAGVPGFTPLGSNVVMQFGGNVNSYSQINFQNINNGTKASTDFIATADNGNDSAYYADFGINSSTFNDPVSYPGFGPNDSYVHNHGGNLILNPESAGTTIKFMVGGTANANVTATISNTQLSVTGAISATGNITGGNIATTGSFSAASLSATGNVTGGNLLTSGIVSASSYIGSVVSVTANITGGNVLTGGLVSATGNVTSAANIAGGNLVATNAVVTPTLTGTTVTISATGGAITLSPSGNVSTSNKNINNLADPVQNQDAATKAYVDNIATTGITIHSAVYVATVANLATTTGGTVTYTQPNGVGNGVGALLTTTGSFNLIDTSNVQTIGTRILVKNEGNAAFNGVYTWANATNIVRSTDTDEYGADSANSFSLNDYFFTTNGNVNAGTAFVVSAPTGTITFGTSNIQFATFSTSQSYTANTSAGISLAGTVINAKVDNVTTAFDVNGNIIVKASAQLTTPNIGAATGTSLSVTGNVTAAGANISGNVLGGNLLTGGLISSTGTITSAANIAGGNLTTSGQVSATGNITSAANIAGGNLSISGTISATSYIGSVVSVTSNITGGNVLTSGLVSATGTITSAANITGGNVLTSGLISATGNVNGGNLVSSALVQGVTLSATGNVIGGNLTTAGQVSATANITGGNVLTGGLVSATGTITSAANITGGNVLTSGLISATSNVTGGNLTTAGQVSSTGNITSAANIAGGNISATGNIAASYYFGNGSQLTGVIASSAGFPITAGTSNLAAAINGNIGVTVAGTSNVVTFASTGEYVTGVLSATGNVTGGNLTTAGQAVATGNVTGGNVLTGGLISATGNVNGGNVIGTTAVKGGNIVISGDNITDTNGRVNFNTALGAVDFAVNGQAANVFYVNATTGTASFGNSTQTTNAVVAFNATNSILMPIGNTTQRPATGVVGMVRFNSIADTLEQYTTNNGWQTVGTPVFTVIGDQQFNGDGTTVAFTLNAAQTTNGVIVSINGVLQIPTSAYSVSGTTLTFTEAPLTGDLIDVRALTTTTTVTSISNQSANAVVAASATAALVNVTGDLSVTGTILGGNINSTAITNGTSNVSVATSGGNIRMNVGGVSNVMTVGTGNLVTINGDLTVTGNATLTGNILGDRVQNGTTSFDIQTASGNANLTIGGTSNVVVWSTTGEYITGTLNVSGNIVSTGANGVANIGSATTYFNTVHAKATSAQYADLAENYAADAGYEPGTVLSFGGEQEVTVTVNANDPRIAGVVSTNPSYIMNSTLDSEHVATLALTGRVPTKVTGPVAKGDMMIAAGNGRAQACATPTIGTVIGKALEHHAGGEGIIEVVVGRL